MHDIPTPQALADTVFVKALTMEKEAETRAAEELMREFIRERAAEMQRVVAEVLKPHMRSWARKWFEERGLDVSALGDAPESTGSALAV